MLIEITLITSLHEEIYEYRITYETEKITLEIKVVLSLVSLKICC